MSETDADGETAETRRSASTSVRWFLSELATGFASLGGLAAAALFHGALLSIPAALAYLAHRLVDAGLLETMVAGSGGTAWMLMAAVIGIAVVEEVYHP
jgi:hypothetical protein